MHTNICCDSYLCVTLYMGQHLWYCYIGHFIILWWRHNGLDSVSNHQPHGYLFNCLFRRRSKKTSKLCVTGLSGLCAGVSPGTGEFPAQVACNVENISIWWRHHDYMWSWLPLPGISGVWRQMKNLTTQYICVNRTHYSDVIKGATASLITSLTIVYSTVHFPDQRKHQSSASLAIVRGIHPPVTGEFPAQRASNAENISIWWRHHASWSQLRFSNPYS